MFNNKLEMDSILVFQRHNNNSLNGFPVEMKHPRVRHVADSRRMIKAKLIYSIHYPSHQCIYINIGTPPPFPVGPPKTLHSTYIKDTNAHVERRRLPFQYNLCVSRRPPVPGLFPLPSYTNSHTKNNADKMVPLS